MSNIEFRMSNGATEKMRLDWIGGTIVTLVPSNPSPSAIFEVRHSKFDILRTMNLASIVMATGSISHARNARSRDDCPEAAQGNRG